MTLRRIGIASCAKVSGILYALGGLLAGLMLSFFSMLGAALGGWTGQPDSGLLSLIFGAGAIVILPVFYGVMGVIIGAITAALYNLVAHLIGGIEIELEPAPAAGRPPGPGMSPAGPGASGRQAPPPPGSAP